MGLRIALILIGIIGYGITISPTVNFWDCGEFIAAANVLGIPHPTGSPLFVMLGRVFILLFGGTFGAAFAVNLISAISSVLCCLLIFEIVDKIVKNKWLGFFAASVSLFGYTFWFNATEASVYNVAMLFIMLQIYFAIKWSDTFNGELRIENGECSNMNARNRYFIFILYIAFLGFGIHTFTLLPLPFILLYILISKNSTAPKPALDFPRRTVASLTPHDLHCTGGHPQVGNSSLRKTSLRLFVLLFYPINPENRGSDKREYLLLFHSQFSIILFLVVLGLSVQLYLPVRSSTEPVLNENNPAVFENFIDVLTRAQYGGENMFVRAMNRRGSFANQFGFSENIGYLGFQLKQFAPPIVSFFLTIIAFVGVWFCRRQSGVLFIAAMFLLSSVGLILYLNFSDGSVAIEEARSRDYFFTPAFLFLACLLAFAFDKMKVPRIVLICAWLVPFLFNFEANNRSNDYIARDFAMNALSSVPPNGILIVYGDNDTFPLWYMQMVENYRTDVVVINESLSYTDWYMEQIRKQYPDLENRTMSFMLGTDEDAPLVGLVHQLGLDEETADSLFVENVTKNYRYGDMHPRGQEANQQTIDIYEYLFSRIGLKFQPNQQ